ncbi:hypothetical protein SLEP1_g9423 [Rubroshorea leprosula]|uniref:Uncharacterized protein n=1 Tax=Rubroshorea leprosula TaxID=152421 RepID=A0AAV5I4V0_9ROSI|nr:hypothetical protein SLEP1_g9423 [Rubroshorea leprosula]
MIFLLQRRARESFLSLQTPRTAVVASQLPMVLVLVLVLAPEEQLNRTLPCN